MPGVNGAKILLNINIYKKIVKPNNPQFLQRAFKISLEIMVVFKVVEAGDEIAETFRQRALNQFLKDALKHQI